MGSNFSIRRLTDTDYPVWKILYIDYNDGYDALKSEEGLAVAWDLLMYKRYQAHGLGICDGSALIGFIHYMLYPSIRTAKLDCYLQDLYVSPEHRNKGLGKKAILHLAAIAKQEKWRRVHWKTQPTNRAAQKLYDSIANRDDYIHYKLDIC